MGSPCLERLTGLVPGGLGAVAIETGTCKGYGTQELAGFFERVYTIELSEQLFAVARDRLKTLGNVQCLQGSSSARLAELLPSLDGPIFFFLDAHWSGDKTVPWNTSKWKGYGHDTAHLGVQGSKPTGPEQCPLAEELAVIARLCRGPANVLIDDVKNIGRQDSGFPGEDWTHISRESLLAAVQPRLLEFRELEKPNQWFLRLK